MKNLSSTLRILCLVLLLSALSFADGIRPVAPPEGSEQPLHNEIQLKYLSMPLAERRVYFADKECRKEMRSGNIYPKPVTLEWMAEDQAGAGAYTVTLSYKPDFAEGTCAVYTTSDKKVAVDNLRIATKYYWKVQCGDCVSQVSTFVTSPVAPRMLRIPKMWSVRDLGGRIGLNGRRVKQDMVLRSGALNNNAKKLEETDVEGNPKLVPGDCVLTEEGMNYLLNVFHLKTEIDLRAPGEVSTMNASPAGPTVTWLNYPSHQYENIQSRTGKKPFAQVFKVFLDEKNYPIDFHCIGGQDRTGAVAFVLNALLGVEENELYLDWECTGFWNSSTGLRHDNKFDRLYKGFDKFPGETIRERVEQYILSMEFTMEDIQHFRDIMLE